MNNPENLTKEEIIRKIRHLEHSIIICYIRSGPTFCINREARVKLLKSYLEISSTHIFSPDRVEKYRKVLINFKKIHGFIPNCMILELVDIPIPTKRPVSTKTITHYLTYYNLQEINEDFNKLKQFIIEN